MGKSARCFKRKRVLDVLANLFLGKGLKEGGGIGYQMFFIYLLLLLLSSLLFYFIFSVVTLYTSKKSFNLEITRVFVRRVLC